MSEVVGYHVEIQIGDRWQPHESYGPDRLSDARADLTRLATRPGSSALRLIEESEQPDGQFLRRTIAFKSFGDRKQGGRGRPAGSGTAPTAGGTAGGIAARPGASRNDVAAGHKGEARSSAVRQPRGSAVAGKSTAGADRKTAPAARSGFSFSDLVSFLLVPLRGAAQGSRGERNVLPTVAPVAKRGDLDVYTDEEVLETTDLFVADATFNQFKAFVDALSGLDVLEEARRQTDFARRVSLFAIGALFSIEEEINIFSDRGRALANICLTLFLDSPDLIAHFVTGLDRYVKEPGASESIRAGSRCLRLYRDADLAGLRREFSEAFGLYERIEAALGGRVKVAVLFTDIVDSTQMTGDLGDEAAQVIIDHHETLVSDFCRRFGGRKIKHLGDGFMLGFGSVERMVTCAVALVDATKALENHPEGPGYQIRCGGHFGEAIQKGDDFFGSTVQLAARISATGGGNEACFCPLIFESDRPIYDSFSSRGVATLKGFEQPVSLVSYR